MAVIYLLSFLLLLASPAVAAQYQVVPLDESNKEGELELVFVTSYGTPVLGDPSITVERLEQGKPVMKLRGARVMKLKYGTYRLRVQYAGAFPVDKIVKVRDPYQVASVCLFIGGIEFFPGVSFVRGQLSKSSLERGCRFVRLINPFADGEIAETKATETGFFALENVRAGKYLALTIGKDGICEMSQVTILFARPTQDLVLSGVELKDE